MKKILLTALVLIATALVSYGQSKAYKDAKKIIDTYEQSVNDAKSCDELDNATINLFVQLMGLIDVEYSESEEMTEKEDHLIEEQIDRIDKKINSKKQQFDCPTEEDEEGSQELIPTTTQEWDDLINRYENVTKNLEGLKTVDFDNMDNLNQLMKVLNEAEPVVTRIESASTDNITVKQSERLEAINDRFIKAAKRLGLDNFD